MPSALFALGDYQKALPVRGRYVTVAPDLDAKRSGEQKLGCAVFDSTLLDLKVNCEKLPVSREIQFLVVALLRGGCEVEVVENDRAAGVGDG